MVITFTFKMFINIGNEYVNTDYIKTISLNRVVIANTKAISYSLTPTDHYAGNLKMASDRIIEISSSQFIEIMEQLNDLEKLKNKNKKLQAKIEQLETMIKYMPGGGGYLEAKTEFETLK